MWWMILFFIIALAVFVVVLFARTALSDRRRFADWNNLRTRGKLIASQLAHLQDAKAQTDGAGDPKVPGKAGTLRKPPPLWPRRTKHKRDLRGFGAEKSSAGPD